MSKSVASNIFYAVFRSQLGPLMALIFIMLVFTIADWFLGTRTFLSWGNVRAIAVSASLIAVPALGMTIIIIAGGIDLSAGTAMTLCGTVLVTVLKVSPYSTAEPEFILVMIFALGLTGLVGCGCGLFNGGLISLTKVVPFIVTLGSMTIFLGVGQIISKESTVYAPSENIPNWLGGLCYTGSQATNYSLVRYVPTSVIIVVVLAVLVALLLRYTVFGRNIFALGSSESTARLCGINIPLTIIGVYTLAGLFVAFGGLLYYANVKNGNPTDGRGKELEIIAAVVLGGGSLSGGRGSILGTVVGALIIVTIRSGCSFLSIPNTYTYIIIGAIIIIAVIVDQLRHGSPEWLFRLLPSKSDE
jgi:ribose/xylose/arabinose/galactoside ABC-type transport system permease subunit